MIALDQLLWVLVSLGYGFPDETVSSAMYRYEKSEKKVGIIMRPLIDKLFFWEPQHCRKAFLSRRVHLRKINQI